MPAAPRPGLRVHHDLSPYAYEVTVPVPGRWRIHWWTWPQWTAIPEAERPADANVYEGEGATLWVLVTPLHAADASG